MSSGLRLLSLLPPVRPPRLLPPYSIRSHLRPSPKQGEIMDNQSKRIHMIVYFIIIINIIIIIIILVLLEPCDR